MNQNNENNGNIEFQDAGWQRTTGQRQSFEAPKIIQWVIKYSGGLIKDEKQAGYVLFAFVALAIAISLMVFFGSGSKIPSPSPTPFQEGKL